MPWCRGRTFLGGGIGSTVERAVKLFVCSCTKMIEVRYPIIRKALVFDEDDEGLETLFNLGSGSLYNVVKDKSTLEIDSVCCYYLLNVSCWKRATPVACSFATG